MRNRLNSGVKRGPGLRLARSKTLGYFADKVQWKNEWKKEDNDAAAGVIMMRTKSKIIPPPPPSLKKDEEAMRYFGLVIFSVFQKSRLQ